MKPQQNGSLTQMPSMIVESPSFLPPWKTSTTASLPAGPLVTVDSPPFQSVIIDSPSFQHSTVFPATFSPGASSDRPSAPSADRPPLVMAAEVKESKPAAQANSKSAGGREKRVSRFMAERM
ncbi:uncharacterized protein FIBRA_02038 [Fibroporia radiculosa]|uniref:Uncharacterized protein n=1 Tax=Fibroporia radiculosa TaxID=599839 RepID=J4HUA0_9APHY|nr:uncharacterized protein FIBRA_02038 [Fibroporia radiculosa]CCM00012.1 predicted protein [Fibroporia radiculosa]